jgi:hypothetical protein
MLEGHCTVVVSCLYPIYHINRHSYRFAMNECFPACIIVPGFDSSTSHITQWVVYRQFLQAFIC